MDENTAKMFLKAPQCKGNILFCSGGKPDEFKMIYKASFRGNEEVRTIIFAYTENKDSYLKEGALFNGSLGRHLSLFSLPDALSKFLKEWTSSSFISNVILRDHHLSAEEVDKQKASFFAQETLLVQQKQKIKAIFEKITEIIPPERQGVFNSDKKISHNKYAISEPQDYAANTMLIKLHTPTYPEGTYVFIDTNNIRLTGAAKETAPHLLKDTVLLDQLLDVFTHADKEYYHGNTMYQK